MPQPPAGPPAGPPARGLRLPFAELPRSVVGRIEVILGSPVVTAVDLPGGFSPGVAARVTTQAGTTAFVKAASEHRNADSPRIHRLEITNLTALRGTGVDAPELLGHIDDDGWVVLVTELLPGANPPTPWSDADLRLFVQAIDDLARAGSPNPVPHLPTVDGLLGTQFEGWRTLAGAPSLPPLPADLVALIGDRVECFAALEGDWVAAAHGTALLHADMRADNVIVHDGRATFVDWPWACVGDPLVDAVFAAPAVSMMGGPDAASFLAMTAAGRHADRDQIAPIAAATIGFFLNQSRLPAPPSLPTLRAFQDGQARAGLPWLVALTD